MQLYSHGVFQVAGYKATISNPKYINHGFDLEIHSVEVLHLGGECWED
jgi:hypothetical protein